jgi:subtilisin family serine protease
LVADAQKAGVLVIAAAGNSASDNDTHPEMPADFSNTYDNVIAVGASDASDRMASFSDYGRSVDLMAPGVNMADITTMDWTGSTGQVIVWANGTSFAAPMVAAAAALIWSADPSLTYLQVKMTS